MKEIVLSNVRYAVENRPGPDGEVHKVLAFETIPGQEMIVVPLSDDNALELAKKLSGAIPNLVVPTEVPGQREAIQDVLLRPPPAKANSRGQH